MFFCSQLELFCLQLSFSLLTAPFSCRHTYSHCKQERFNFQLQISKYKPTEPPKQLKVKKRNCQQEASSCKQLLAQNFCGSIPDLLAANLRLSVACLQPWSLQASCDLWATSEIARLRFFCSRRRDKNLQFLQWNGREPARGGRGHSDFAMRALCH